MNNLIVEKSNIQNENYCLIFSLDNKSYGINVSNVLEIIKVPKITIPQKMPKHVLGVITYNNISMRVIDLSGILSHKTNSYNIDSQIIIVKTEEAFFGIITDKVLDIRMIRPANIHPLPYQSENNLIQYIYKFKEMFVSILDLNSIQNVIQKTQFETSEIDISQILPISNEDEKELEKRQNELIKKYDTNIGQIYYDQEQYIIFEINENICALPIKQIKEIVKYKNVSIIKLPTQYDYVEGIFNLRGDFISVINFKKFLNIENNVSIIKDSSMLIVLDIQDFKMALLVDNIIDIVTVMSSQITNKFDNKFETKYVVSELNINNKIISVVSLDRILADERLYIKD